MTDAPRSRSRQLLVLACWCALAAAGPVALYGQFPRVVSMRLDGARFLYDDFDMGVYFNTSRWAVTEEVLFREVKSEYPLAANYLFAAVRVKSGRFTSFAEPLHRFTWLWMSCAWVVYVGLLSRVAAHARWPTLLLFAQPAVIFFTLVRFDIYPVALTFLALQAASRDRHRTAALWLGLAVAVKGYPLFVLPSFAVFVWRRAGLKSAAVASLIAMTPLVAATAFVYSYAGKDGVLGPYKFHAVRGLDSGSSTYDAVSALGGTAAKRVVEWPRAVNALQAAAALAAAGLLALRRREDAFAGFVAAGGFALVALLSLSPFYSPQFVMWLLPFAVFAGSRLLRVVMHVYLVATWLYFPLAFDMVLITVYAEKWVNVFKSAVVVMTACLLFVGLLALVRLCRPRRPTGEPPAPAEAEAVRDGTTLLPPSASE